MPLWHARRWRVPILLAACLLLLSAAAGDLAANPIDPVGPSFNELRSNVRGELERRGIPETDIRLIDLKPRLGSQFMWPGAGSRKRQVIGYNAWVRLKSCDTGYVVVQMNRYGFIQQSFAQGACSPPGF